jgi:hypothetical protein
MEEVASSPLVRDRLRPALVVEPRFPESGLALNGELYEQTVNARK